MPQSQCPSCKKDVDEKATDCPFCGKELPKEGHKKKKLVRIFMILIGAFIVLNIAGQYYGSDFGADYILILIILFSMFMIYYTVVKTKQSNKNKK